MKARRLIGLWEPPQGYRLESVLATTYELQADFLEEDLLPVALDLRLSPARGRDFRLELENALKDTEVSILFHPRRYQRGLRRSPRIDLVPLPEGPYPKLHAKVALLRFANPAAQEIANQIVRLVVGSANLTSAGYRTNIEVAASIDDAPGASVESATAVRDAVNWLVDLVRSPSAQVSRQIRDMRAVFDSRRTRRQRSRIRFVGLPSQTGFPPLAKPWERVDELTIASPFWPSGDDPSDVAAALRERCGGGLQKVRLVGPANPDDQGSPRPVIPAALVRSLLAAGATVEVAAARPDYGCNMPAEDDVNEFDDIAKSRVSKEEGNRSLHAKVLLATGGQKTRLAIGSFNLTRKGLGLVRGGNAEAGLLWELPNDQDSELRSVVGFGTGWRKVTVGPEEYVREPNVNAEEGGDEGTWPAFILSLRAKRDHLLVDGDAATWPDEVVIRMRDLRSRLSNREEWFDPWTIQTPSDSNEVFSASTPLNASWLDRSPARDSQPYAPLADLEAEVSWDGSVAILPVLFEDKDLFPVVESRSREDEQSLIAWFLGLRPAGEAEDAGFGHSIDPVRGDSEAARDTHDILSYLVRDFVHALPGIRSRLADAGTTEIALRSALLGHRSPVELARESLRAYQSRLTGRPRKTAVATAFQLVELHRLLETVRLPEMADGVTETLRVEAVEEVGLLLKQVVDGLTEQDRTEVFGAYLDLERAPP